MDLSYSTKRRRIRANARASIQAVEDEVLLQLENSETTLGGASRSRDFQIDDAQTSLQSARTHSGDSEPILSCFDFQPDSGPSSSFASDTHANATLINDDDVAEAHFQEELNTLDNSDEGEISEEEDVVGKGTEDCVKEGLGVQLASWAVQFGITLTALGSLLSILRVPFPNLPRDPRTLLKTPRNENVKDIEGGQYFHFGIVASLTKILTNMSCKFGEGVASLYLQVNIDGLPLFKSSSIQFWPILCRVCQPFLSEPVIVGLYCGVKKPTNLDEYLKDFIDEMLLLQSSPVHLEGVGSANILLSCFVCDAPARAFLKQIKGHSGYFSCEKCNQKGSWHGGRVVFSNTIAQFRTDADFHSQKDKNHHIGNSPLCSLNLKMVSQFPLDFMHLVCLGVVKRLLFYWIKSPCKKGFRLGQSAITQISEFLCQIGKNIPREFSRKTRSLSELERWKATEFRLFLLYVGMVALKKNVTDIVYKHFLLLSVAIFCLASPDLCISHAEWAHALLVSFVVKSEEIYGAEFVVYNVHGLLHLAEDVKRFGPIDSYSAFSFESFLGTLKRLIRKPANPLAQAINRLREKSLFPDIGKPVLFNNTPLQSYEGPLPCGYDEKNTLQYRQIYTNNVFLSVSEGDNCVQLNDGYAIIQNIISVPNSREVLVVVERFSKKSSFFDYPCDSSLLGIVKASNLSGHLIAVPLSSIKKKSVALPYGSKYILIPLI